MNEVELDELVAHLEHHFATPGADPLAPAIEARAARLTELLADLPATEPRQRTLIRYLWRRFWALPVGSGEPELRSAVDRAKALPGTDTLPLGLRVLVDLDPGWDDLVTTWSPVEDADLNRVVAAQMVVAHLAPPGSMERAVHLNHLAAQRFNRYLKEKGAPDRDAAIDAWREIAAILGDEHDQVAAMWANIGLALRARYRDTGAATDLDEAIAAGRRAVRDERLRLPVILSSLSISLRDRYELRRDEADLDEAIPLARQAVDQMGPGHPELQVALMNLARALSFQHSRTGAERDLEEAAAVAARAAEPVLRTGFLNAQGVETLEIHLDVLTRRAEHHRDGDDLARAFEVVDLLLTAASSPRSRARHLRARRDLLVLRFEFGQRLADLDEAIAFARGIPADEASPDDTAIDALTLARLLFARDEITGDLTGSAAAVLLMAGLLSPAQGRGHPLAPTVRQVFEELARTGDPAPLFDDSLTDQAHLLRKVPLGTVSDPATMCLYGWLFWLRSFRQEDELRAREDQNWAVTLFYPVYQVASSVLPAPVTDYYASVADDQSDEPSLASDRFREQSVFAAMRYEQTGSRQWMVEALHMARRAVEAARAASVSAEAAALNNLGVIVVSLPADEQTEPLLVEAVEALRTSVELSPPDEPYLPGRLSVLGALLSRLHRHTRDPDVANEAVGICRRSVELTPDGHPSAGLHLSNLGSALLAVRDPSVDDIAEVVDVFRRATEVMAPDHHGWPGLLSNLGLALSTLSVRTKDPVHSAEAVSVLRKADAALPDGARRAEILETLVHSLRDLFLRDPDPAHLAEAVDRAREWYALLPPGGAAAQDAALELANLLRETGDGRAEAAQLLRQHLDVPEPLGMDSPATLTRIGLRLMDLAEELGETGLWRDAITALRHGVSISAQDDELADARRVSLVTGLHDAYTATGAVPLLHEAVSLWDALLEDTPSDHPNLASRLEGCVQTLLRLHFDLGDHSRVDDACALAARAADLPGSGRSEQMLLAETLAVRSRVTGDPKLLRRAVQVGRAAFRSEAGEDDGVGANFPGILLSYYLSTGANELLDEAIDLGRRVVAALPGTRSWGSGSLNTLAQCLTLRYQRSGDIDALREAVRFQREATKTVPVAYPFRSLYLVSLQEVLQTLAGFDDDPALLAEATDCARAAVASAGDSPDFRATASASLARSLLAQHRKFPDTTLLAEAAEAAESALRDGDAHPQRDVLLYTLAQVLAESDERDKLVRARDLHRAAASYPSGANNNQFVAAGHWAELAMTLDDPHDALSACRHAIELLLVQVGPALRRADRERGLAGAAWLPRTVAAAALATGRPELAVELMEQTRGILMAEALHLRMDLSDVQARDPDLAEEFTRVGLELTRHRPELSPAAALTVEQRTELAERWQVLLDRIRELPGRADFLRPPTVTALQEGITDGAVIVVTASEWRSDALVLDGTSVQTVGLPAVNLDEVVDRANAYLNALDEFARARLAFVANRADDRLRARFRDRLAAMEKSIHDTLEWLWETVAEPVLRHLGHTGTPTGEWPRVWWCPTGPFALLPLHAAGHHRAQPPVSVIDRVVSSYTPTVRALQAVPNRLVSPEPRTLIVSVTAPGHPELPSSGRERDLLVGLFPGDRHTLLEGASATREAVLRELAGHDWVHLSCHGHQDLDNPSNGGLALFDGALSIADVNSQEADLVFLSACQTATTGVRLTDEMMTLASAMRYGGTSHVIATLWTVYDTIAADVAELVYEHLARNGSPDSREAGVALHQAVRALRERHPGNPSVWTPFVHIGH
ncbi:CHAT domain-containing protein [Lentzea nigeriaca]|uniref:CHAT domain-containing protein n=1 Tax=Lentzea nigeriaca TaxID=1128665 RepID=UPI00195BAA14|nr:CHAT domain-containing protein [Lentzea nigeriaca]MBM7863877.1 tetratricopeptide (TPR) repeat protein [Lentzea nigeriaca]